MKKDIILAGVGGQGILSIATIIGYAAIESGLNLKQAEVHGMSQRGGDVQSHLRISDKEIYSDLIPHGGADMIISVEPMEALRYKPYLAENGWLITNTKPFVNIPNYPDMEKLMAEVKTIQNHIAIDADGIAKDLNKMSAKASVRSTAAAPSDRRCSRLSPDRYSPTRISPSRLSMFRSITREFLRKMPNVC